MSLRGPGDATPERVMELAQDNLDMTIRIKALEALISGLIEAQRPLLEEWHRLKSEQDCVNLDETREEMEREGKDIL